MKEKKKKNIHNDTVTYNEIFEIFFGVTNLLMFLFPILITNSNGSSWVITIV